MFDKEIPKDKISFLCAANLILKEREKCAYYFLFLYQLLKFIATNISANSSIFEEIKKGNQPPLVENEKMYSNIVRSLQICLKSESKLMSLDSKNADYYLQKAKNRIAEIGQWGLMRVIERDFPNA